MPAPTPREIKSAADTVASTTARTLTLTNAIAVGDRVYVIQTVTGYSTAAFPLTESLGNALGTAVLTGAPSSGYRIYSYVATVAGTPTFTVTKNGGATSAVVTITAIVIAAADDQGVDGTYKAVNGNSNGSGLTCFVTLDTSTIATNLVVALMLTSDTGRATPTLNTSDSNVTYTDSGPVNNVGAPSHSSMRYVTGPTTALGVFNPGWTLSKANADQYYCVGFAIKGITTDPAITGGTAAPVHGSTGNTLTGSNFGGSQGAGGSVIGGQAQVETSWADGTVTYTADRGVNLNGVAVNAVVTNNGGTPSNSYALTGFQSPAGYEYVTLTSVNSTAAYRITAIADLAIGNQLEWDNALVTINADGTYVADPSVTEFNVRIGVTGDGWGSLAVQTVNAASPGGANSATGGRLIRPFNKRVGLGF